MSLLQKLGQGQAYFKGGTLGFQGSGKTFTMALTACAIREVFGLKGPVAMFDTEGGSDYIGDVVKALTGEDLVGVKSRSLDDLAAFVKEAQKEGISVALAESMTHVWRNVCESHLAGVNSRRKQDGHPPRQRLEMNDWTQLKPLWNTRWSDLYLNVPLHLIVAGRAGYEYDMSQNEETGRKELIKTGVKMKTEGEFGFEPSLLWQMDLEQEPDGQGGFRIVRYITVLKDRFNVIDGQVFPIVSERDPRKAMERVLDAFRPHIERLTPGVHTTVDTRLRTETGADEDGDSEWARERKTRTILAEEIAGVLLLGGLAGQSMDDKRARAELLQSVFGTPSWTAIENMPSDRQREGLAKIQQRLADRLPKPKPAEPEASAEAKGGVSFEEAERLKLAAKVQGLETRAKLDLEAQAKMRQEHLGGKTPDAASLDELNAYAEVLQAMKPNGNGRKRAAAQEATA